jgi:hypothetical protein
MKQVQIPLEEVVDVVRQLTSEFLSWEEVFQKYPEYISTEATE